MAPTAASPKGVTLALLEMYTRYVRGVPALLATVRSFADVADTDADALGRLQTFAHQLHGTAGSYGFARATDLGAAMEDRVARWRKDPSVDAGQRGNAVREFADELERALSGPAVPSILSDHLGISTSALWQAQRYVSLLPGSRTMMVVEDDPAISSLFRTVFEAIHMRVETYDEGAAFLDAVRASPPRKPPKFKVTAMPRTLVMLDVDLPGMDGPTINETLTEEYPGMFGAVFISSYADGEAREHAERAGGLDYMQKPVTIENLLIKMPQWLGMLSRPGQELIYPSAALDRRVAPV